MKAKKTPMDKKKIKKIIQEKQNKVSSGEIVRKTRKHNGFIQR